MSESRKYLAGFPELSREYIEQGIAIQSNINSNMYDNIRDELGEYVANKMMIQLGSSIIYTFNMSHIDNEWLREDSDDIVVGFIEAAETYNRSVFEGSNTVNAIDEFFNRMVTNIGREYLDNQEFSDNIAREVGSLLVFGHRESVDYVRDNLPQSTDLLHNLYEFSNIVDYGGLEESMTYDAYFYLARLAYERNLDYESIMILNDNLSKLDEIMQLIEANRDDELVNFLSNNNREQSSLIALTLARLRQLVSW